LQIRANDGRINKIGKVCVLFMGGQIMDGYMNTKEAAIKWGISVRQVQNHCKKGRISGIQKVGTNYLIPINAVKPKYKYVYGDTVGKE
jgi:hypothetical protein